MTDSDPTSPLLRPLVEVGFTFLRDALILVIRVVTDAASRFMLTEGIVRPLDVLNDLPASVALEVGNLLIEGPVDLLTVEGEVIDDMTGYALDERLAFLQIEDENVVLRSVAIPISTAAWHDLISRVRSTCQIINALARAEETAYTGKITSTSRPARAPSRGGIS